MRRMAIRRISTARPVRRHAGRQRRRLQRIPSCSRASLNRGCPATPAAPCPFQLSRAACCLAGVAALFRGQVAAASEAMFIMLVGEGLEAYAAGRTSAAIERFVEQMPRRARLFRDGEEIEVAADSLVAGDTIVVRAGER